VDPQGAADAAMPLVDAPDRSVSQASVSARPLARGVFLGVCCDTRRRSAGSRVRTPVRSSSIAAGRETP
jgi:hypothetical protein